MYVYIYIRHTLIAWVQFLWSRPQTTSHVVLVRPRGDRKIVRVQEPKWSRGNMVLVRQGSDRCVKNIVWKPKWSRSSPKCDRARERKRKQSDTASEENKAKERVWQILAQHFAHFRKCFRPPRGHLHRYTPSPEPSIYMLHVVTTDIHLHISRYSSVRGILCACVFLVCLLLVVFKWPYIPECTVSWMPPRNLKVCLVCVNTALCTC